MILQAKPCLLLLLIVCLTSCNAQVEEEQPPKQTDSPPVSVPWRAMKDQHDHDPYFSETTDVVTKTAPQAITRNILQTKDGKIWLATWNGAVSYDGEVFTNHTNKAGLRRHRFFTLLEDKHGDLWFGTIGAGLYRYDGITFTNITTDHGLGSNEIECIMQDKAGNLWFGTGAGVSRYDGTSFRNFTKEDGLPGDDPHSIAQDQTGKIWVAFTSGLCYLDGDSFVPVNKADGQPFSNVRTILSDKTGALWFGGNDGLIRYDGTTFTTLLEDFTGYLFEDSTGDIWISIIPQQSPEKTGLYHYTANAFPLPFAKDKFAQVLKIDGMSFGITEDKDGNIWFGTLNGACRYDGEGFEWFRGS